MATHPQNSIPAFLHAMACGADGVELDIAATLDDELVLTHDLTLQPGGRVVREHLAAELALPTLDELLALPSPDNFFFDIEAKRAADSTPDPERYARLIGDTLRRAATRHRLLVRSFDHAILRAFHPLEPDIPLVALIAYASDDWPAIARAAAASIISPLYSTVTAERVKDAHDAGIGVSVWTVNHPAEWTRLAALGVDAIITDNPCAAVAFFAR